MEENTGSELETESGVSEEAASPEPSSSEGSNEEAQAASQPKPEESTQPFHEHPRFKELVEQKNQALATQKALEERYSQLEARLKDLAPKAETPKDELIEHLKTIDPRFAARMEELTKSTSVIQQLQEKLASYEKQQVTSQAVNNINTLHEQNKVTPELKSFINNEMDRLYMNGSLKTTDQIPGLYKAIHDTYSKFIDGIKRAERESYVKDKKVDSKIPSSQPKGKPAGPADKKFQFSKDPEIARQQVVSRYLKTAKAEADI